MILKFHFKVCEKMMTSYFMYDNNTQTCVTNFMPFRIYARKELKEVENYFSFLEDVENFSTQAGRKG